MAKPLLGLQLYTVRDALRADHVATLKRIAQLGYDAVQVSGLMPPGPVELKRLLDELGLRVAGIHVSFDSLQADPGECIDLARLLDTVDVVCAGAPRERSASLDDWLGHAEVLDSAGQACRARGMRLSYHNHDFEFATFDGRCALDILLERTAAENLLAELDTYWIRRAGEDPVRYLNRYASRCPILHLKDMAADEARSFAEVGRGILDWQAIHRAALDAGVEWYCVEQDVCAGDPLESARISAEFIRGSLGV